VRRPPLAAAGALVNAKDMSGVEVEWQFDVRDVDAVGRWLACADLGPDWTVTRRAALRLRDVYFDTADWAVARTRHGLRVRTGGGDVEAALKAFGRSRGGAKHRRELVEPLSDGRLATLLAARGAVGRRVRAIVGSTRLRRLFSVHTRRGVWDVRRRGRIVAELALDRTRIVARRGTRKLERVEIEVKRGAPAVVARFVATLRRGRRLDPARRSKFETGLAAAGLSRPAT
jgi:inorganic triphosphatase YgiF